MKDMYTFHLNDECVEKTYSQVCKAYEIIFDQLDLKYFKATASCGSMGGKQSHEYHIESEIGEDKIFTCNKCNKSISIDLVEDNKNGKIKQNDLCKIIACGNDDTNDNLQQHKKCIEIGHTFILGDRYTKSFPIHTNQQQHQQGNIKMGCYGIGVSRLMQSCIETSNNNGPYPDWPIHIAPFQLAILPAKDGSKHEQKSKQLVPYLCDMLDNLNSSFKDDILLDDRTWMSIGSRIIDTKLLGIPFLITLGKQIDDENIEIVINSPRVSKLLNKDKIMCHSRETAHVLKQLINDYLYTKKQSKIANYFS
jgi:prolyl-tRNA synthetase